MRSKIQISMIDFSQYAKVWSKLPARKVYSKNDFQKSPSPIKLLTKLPRLFVLTLAEFIVSVVRNSMPEVVGRPVFPERTRIVRLAHVPTLVAIQ